MCKADTYTMLMFIIYTMSTIKTLVFNLNRFDRYVYIKRASFRRRIRLLFPSPAEVRFVQLMGGRVLCVPFIKNPYTHFSLCWIMSLGKYLARENIRREVRAGAMFIDFGAVTPYYKKGIEIDGRNFHRDVLKERERDLYVADYGWQLLHVQADVLWREPSKVQRAVLAWLAD